MIPYKRHLLIALAAGLSLLTACSTGKSNVKNLINNVDSYNRDLLFERYEIAAKYITPESRLSWLDDMRSQNLRFAEIEVLATEDCSQKTEGAPPCMTVLSQMQWYANNSPTIKTTRVQAKWQYDKEAGGWVIVEQNEL